MPKAYRTHLTSAADLRTSYEATRAGFVSLALEKNRRATPLIAQARALQEAASHATRPIDLLRIEDIQLALVTASGVSDKAMQYLNDDDRRAAVLGLIENFLDPAGGKFVEELVFRFLLVRGDSLGGAMRNVAGALAQRRFAEAIIAHLKIAGRSYRWLSPHDNRWVDMPAPDQPPVDNPRGLFWMKSRQPRKLLYNVKAPLVRNSIDVVLLKAEQDVDASKMPSLYVALGELKGGIDPAGADEHWKTAATALSRIRTAFATESLNPHTFFVGAAIEAKMAGEIWQFLQNGVLENAGNLTSDTQLAAVARWICSL